MVIWRTLWRPDLMVDILLLAWDKPVLSISDSNCIKDYSWGLNIYIHLWIRAWLGAEQAINHCLYKSGPVCWRIYASPGTDVTLYQSALKIAFVSVLSSFQNIRVSLDVSLYQSDMNYFLFYHIFKTYDRLRKAYMHIFVKYLFYYLLPNHDIKQRWFDRNPQSNNR